jgi:hypothetical protein
VDELDEIIEAGRSAPPTFHPVHERDTSAWFPGNEAASLLLQVQHIWEDLLHLSDIRIETSGDYRKKLLLKYVVIEVRSIIQLIDRLQSLVMKTPTFNPREKQGWREITEEEREESKLLFAIYNAEKHSVSKKIRNVRNEICAHRGNLNWQEVMSFWDAITPELVNPLLATVPALFNHLKELDLYDWNRSYEDGSI